MKNIIRTILFLYRKQKYREGVILNRFVARDIRREIEVIDVSELRNGYIIARCRTWNVLYAYKGLKPKPEFSEPQRKAISSLWKYDGPIWGGPVVEENKGLRMNWPKNADGDVMRRLETHEFNFDKEAEIDFNIDFDHWPLSEEERKLVSSLYPDCHFYDPDEEDIQDGYPNGYVQIQIVAKVTYELVTSMQDKITEQMKPIGGWCNTWGVMQE